MEYYNVVTNCMSRFTFMWSGKLNDYSLESQGIFIIKQIGNPVTVIHVIQHAIVDIHCLYMLSNSIIHATVDKHCYTCFTI